MDNTIPAESLCCMLEDTVYKIKNNTSTINKTITSRSGETFDIPRIERKYDADDLSRFFKLKTDIVQELESRGLISDDEYVKYMLSEDPSFIPNLKVKSDE